MKPFIITLLGLIIVCSGGRLDYGYGSRGSHHLLYESTSENILQLNRYNFADTVYGADTAFVIQFYAYWCGHCKRYVSQWKEFSRLFRRWHDVIRVAVVDCGDRFNSSVCGENKIRSVPTIKYFPRNSQGPNDGIRLEGNRTVSGLLEQLLNLRMSDFSHSLHSFASPKTVNSDRANRGHSQKRVERGASAKYNEEVETVHNDARH